jgi:hypothetical protein
MRRKSKEANRAKKGSATEVRLKMEGLRYRQVRFSTVDSSPMKKMLVMRTAKKILLSVVLWILF